MRSILKITSNLLFLVFLIISTSCSSSSLDTNDTITYAGPATKVYYTVLADETLDDNYKNAIFQALNEWSDKTHYLFKYELTFIDMSKVDNTFIPQTLKIFVTDPGPGLLGWTDFKSKTKAAYMKIKPDMSEDVTRRVMLHELGHALDLRFANNDIHYHGPYQSVMYPSINDGSENLECPELTSFCTHYDCTVTCTNLSK